MDENMKIGIYAFLDDNKLLTQKLFYITIALFFIIFILILVLCYLSFYQNRKNIIYKYIVNPKNKKYKKYVADDEIKYNSDPNKIHENFEELNTNQNKIEYLNIKKNNQNHNDDIKKEFVSENNKQISKSSNHYSKNILYDDNNNSSSNLNNIEQFTRFSNDYYKNMFHDDNTKNHSNKNVMQHDNHVKFNNHNNESSFLKQNINYPNHNNSSLDILYKSSLLN
jgi:hypothetical protein